VRPLATAPARPLCWRMPYSAMAYATWSPAPVCHRSEARPRTGYQGGCRSVGSGCRGRSMSARKRRRSLPSPPTTIRRCDTRRRLAGAKEFLVGLWIAPGSEGRDVEVIGAAVDQPSAVGRCDNTSGRREHGVARSHIPLAGLCKPRIEIDAALGDTAELQRRAARNLRGNQQPLQERVGLRIEMRSADPQPRGPPAAPLVSAQGESPRPDAARHRRRDADAPLPD
jgi:hypothetical protein